MRVFWSCCSVEKCDFVGKIDKMNEWLSLKDEFWQISEFFGQIGSAKFRIEAELVNDGKNTFKLTCDPK